MTTKDTPRLLARFVPQVYRNDNDDFPLELDAISFDATEAVLALPLERIRALMYDELDPEEMDDLVPRVVRDQHDGPFYVGLDGGSVMDFFGITEITALNQELLDQVRTRHGVDQEKTYQVRIERTVTTAVWVEVSAKTESQAQELALDTSADIDFNSTGEKSDPVYVVSDISQIISEEMVDGAQPAAQRPRG